MQDNTNLSQEPQEYEQTFNEQDEIIDETNNFSNTVTRSSSKVKDRGTLIIIATQSFQLIGWILLAILYALVFLIPNVYVTSFFGGMQYLFGYPFIPIVCHAIFAFISVIILILSLLLLKFPNKIIPIINVVLAVIDFVLGCIMITVALFWIYFAFGQIHNHPDSTPYIFISIIIAGSFIILKLLPSLVTIILSIIQLLKGSFVEI